MYTTGGRFRLKYGWLGVLLIAGCVGAILWTLAAKPRPGRASADDIAAMLEAAVKDDVTAVDRLLAAGVPADAMESPALGYTPLMYAARFGRIDVAKRLIAAGANVRAVSRGFGTPLASAAAGGFPEMVRLMLDHGAEANQCNPDGHSPLMHAASVGNAECVELLLAARADVNAKDCMGNTPLLVAAAAGNEATMNRLITAGADVDAHDNDGKNAAMLLAEAMQRAAAGEPNEMLASENEW